MVREILTLEKCENSFYRQKLERSCLTHLSMGQTGGHALLYLFLMPGYLVPPTSTPGKGRTKTLVILGLFYQFPDVGWLF